MSSPSKPFTFISTFAGCGGSSVGYTMAGGIDLAAVEYDRHACETYRLNAMYFGVPQNRQRVIFIGVRKDFGIRPSHPKPQRRPIALKAICPDVLASRSMKINPWIPASQPCCTISKTPYKGLFQTRIGEREPTETELSELASFPEDFIFPQNKRLRWAHIGNSVPPLLMKAIAEHIRDHILAMC